MTVSGRVSGAEKGGDDNLRPGQEAPFATYLARVVDELQRRHRIAFRTLPPVNEPNTDYWFAANMQEGSHWSPARQAAMIDASAAALARRRLMTVIAAPDETNSELFLADWAGYPAATRARIAQLNVHSYGMLHQTGVRDIARASGIRLWMSENDTPGDKLPEDFTDPTGDGWAPEDIKEMRAKKLPFLCHAFESACADLDVEHRLTKPRHPWTNGQVERMNRTIKKATVKRHHYETHDQLRQHLTDFVAAYNFARRLKTLRGLTPYEAICKAWTDDPSRFISNPHHQSPGPNI